MFLNFQSFIESTFSYKKIGLKQYTSINFNVLIQTICLLIFNQLFFLTALSCIFSYYTSKQGRVYALLSYLAQFFLVNKLF